MRLARLSLALCLACFMAVYTIPNVSAANSGLTRSEVVSAFGSYSVQSIRTIPDGHGGALTVAEGTSNAISQLSWFMVWHGTARVASFRLYDTTIANYSRDRVTLRIGDIPNGGRTSYGYFSLSWNGKRLVFSRPLPKQAPLGGGGSSSPSSPPQSTGPGFLGVQTANPPSDWSVTGCEVMHTIPGTPAATAGLIGANDRVDPVGDVIYALGVNGIYMPVSDCAAFTSDLSITQPGQSIDVYYYHRDVTLFVGSWQAVQVSVTLAPQPCPAPITGQITSTGNRIDLTAELQGTFGQSQAFTAMFDTGGDVSYFPNSLLQQLGFAPTSTTVSTGVIPGASTTAFLYSIPGSDLLVEDNGQFVPLAQGEITVEGIPGLGFSGISSDVLKHGVAFSTAGGYWSLTPACSY